MADETKKPYSKPATMGQSEQIKAGKAGAASRHRLRVGKSPSGRVTKKTVVMISGHTSYVTNCSSCNKGPNGCGGVTT